MIVFAGSGHDATVTDDGDSPITCRRNLSASVHDHAVITFTRAGTTTSATNRDVSAARCDSRTHTRDIDAVVISSRRCASRALDTTKIRVPTVQR